jgi:hypothetical protein
MAGTIIVSSIKTDTDNSFIVRSNTGATLFSVDTTSISIPDGSITSAMIANGTVIAADILDGTITDAKIAAVANTKITGLITSGQIATVANTQITGDPLFSAGSNTAPSITTSGDTDTGIFFSAADTIDFTEGGTAVGQFDSSANFKFNSGYGSVATAYGCRAWVRFNAQGTLTINASGGVTSVTDNGTGDYTVNFSITFPDANYALAATTDADLVNGAICYMNNLTTPTTTTCRLATKLLNGTTFDRDRVMATFIR